MTKLLLVGCGLHARTFYLPALNRMRERGEQVEVAAVVELVSQQESLEHYFDASLPTVRRIYVEPGPGGRISRSVAGELRRVVRQCGIQGVIISTDPLNHKAYALWACRMGLHVLLDKPVTTRINAALKVKEASGLIQDYRQILQAYEKSYLLHKNVFLVFAHRRYHPSLDFALQTIEEVSGQTGCPVTNIHCYHCDGQWRLPAEMTSQAHHSYYDGHGKVSHSGYHFLDSVARFWKAGLASGKTAEAAEVVSSFIRPSGLLRQLAREDYLKLFGEEYAGACPVDDATLDSRFSGYGEIDAEICATFLSGGEPVALATLSLLHNGFSRRSWMRPGADLYKGNGRVKHEQHRIHVGPFLGLQIHSYQAKDRHDVCQEGDETPGGNNHYEIFVFRNSEIIGGKPFERLEAQDFERQGVLSSDRLHIDQIKEGALTEFLSCMNGPFERKAVRSDLADHALGVELMSAAYRSSARRIQGKNPLSRFLIST